MQFHRLKIEPTQMVIVLHAAILCQLFRSKGFRKKVLLIRLCGGEAGAGEHYRRGNKEYPVRAFADDEH